MIEKYNPKEIENRWYKQWEDAGYFSPSDNGAKSDETFCIMLPPPNVTGSLHMGHAFQDTIMDVLVRYNRMQGKKTLWQCGTDHAGIATQMVVERQLLADGIKRTDLGREKFLKKYGNGKKNHLVLFNLKFAVSAHQLIGKLNVSPWMKVCQMLYKNNLFNYMKRD